MWCDPRCLALAAAALLSSCTHAEPPAEAPAATNGLSAEQLQAIEEYRQEIEIGRSMAGRLLAYYGIVEDRKALSYVNQVGNLVASYSDAPERRYMFAILKHESINAFACPGGYILITMGALRSAKSEAELAAVLGHEVAHVGKKHMFDALKKMKQQELSEAAKARDAGGPMQEALQFRARPQAEDSSAGSRLAEYLTGKAGAGLNVLAAAQAGMSLLTGKGLDQKVEYEADQEGVRYATRAGYDPKAMLGYLKRLEAKSEKKLKNLEKTHPPIEARRGRIEAFLLTMDAKDIVGATGEERFTRVKQAFPKIDRE